MKSLIEAKNFDEVISFSKEIKKHLIITRGEKGAISINNGKIFEIEAKKYSNCRSNWSGRSFCC